MSNVNEQPRPTENPEHVPSLGLEAEFEHSPVPQSHRKSFGSVAAVWFGFPMILTNAVFGGVIVASLGFWLGIFAILLNLTGQPAASIPAGFTKDGLPVGLQIIGRHLDDPMVLRASAAFEAAAPWADRWPSLPTDTQAVIPS